MPRPRSRPTIDSLATAFGARCIAVATGGHAREVLEAHGEWVTIDRVPAPPAFGALIDREAAPVPGPWAPPFRTPNPELR